ncbi:MAG: YegS/Rv2252/BmrU family lipid kinase [Chloroflexi bacterium]|nr:YegS/Rv2252/BmrU family lipid kinase [Chloroflexota bacterium]
MRSLEARRQVALVINLRSRSAPRTSEKALAELERQGVLVRESHLVRGGPDLVKTVRASIERGARTVVVGGGDGTISAVVDLFAHRPELTLGLLPMGTGNEVARVLGIPLDIEGACRVIAHGSVSTVDLGEANGNYFIHTALVGYPAHVNHSIPAWLKLPFGKAAYAYSLLLSLVQARSFHATIAMGSTRWDAETVLVVVGNRAFHVPGSILLPRPEGPERGLLVYTPRDSGSISLLRLAVSLWITRRRQPSLLLFHTAESASVVAEPVQEVDLDGEFGKTTPVEFRLAQEALRVLVPDPSAAQVDGS